jgi:hypothetical protein
MISLSSLDLHLSFGLKIKQSILGTLPGNPLDVRFTNNFSGAQRCFRYLGRYKQYGGRRSSFSFLRMGKRCPTQNMKWTMEQW